MINYLPGLSNAGGIPATVDGIVGGYILSDLLQHLSTVY